MHRRFWSLGLILVVSCSEEKRNTNLGKVSVNLAAENVLGDPDNMLDDDAAGWVGMYRGILGGNSSRLTISESEGGLAVELVARSKTCAREFRGSAISGSPTALTVQGADEFGKCTITLIRTSLGVAVVEGKCESDPTACSLDGNMQRV